MTVEKMRCWIGLGERDWDGVELKKRLSGADLYVDVYTGPVPPSDHLAGGLWVYVPDSATNVDDFVFGAFVDGNDPFEQSELSALTGVVTYEGEGDVTLVYSDADPAARRNYFPDASVTLRVDFDNETVSGTIRSFNADGEPVNLNMAELTLEEANIGDSNSGFFSGDTRGTTPKGVNGEGKWGGQFFGNGDGAPKGVAGTFGFTTSNGEESVLGVFGASRSSEGRPPGSLRPIKLRSMTSSSVRSGWLLAPPATTRPSPPPAVSSGAIIKVRDAIPTRIRDRIRQQSSSTTMTTLPVVHLNSCLIQPLRAPSLSLALKMGKRHLRVYH